MGCDIVGKAIRVLVLYHAQASANVEIVIACQCGCPQLLMFVSHEGGASNAKPCCENDTNVLGASTQ